MKKQKASATDTAPAKEAAMACVTVWGLGLGFRVAAKVSKVDP